MAIKIRIKWLDIELTEALLIRGRWWWRRMAHVHRRTMEDVRAGCYRPDIPWVFTYSEVPAIADSALLESERERQLQHGIDSVDWVKAHDQPKKRHGQASKIRLLR